MAKDEHQDDDGVGLYGWDLHWSAAWKQQGSAADGLLPARILREDRRIYTVVSADGVSDAELSGKMKRTGRQAKDYPVVGDWVGMDSRQRRIEWRLDRRSIFSRKGRGEFAQHIAANVDEVLTLIAADEDFNQRRLERYLVLIWGSGALPTVVLTKTDLLGAEQVEGLLKAVRACAPGCAHLAVSATTPEVETLRQRLQPGKTFAVVGASGVGKSTLANVLLGEQRMAVGAVRDSDRKGRHTTVHRELLRLPSGALLIDTPGMRELAMWGVGSGLDDAFAEIAAAAQGCRFTDCAHQAEPGCGVRAALADGEIESSRFEHFLQLHDEFSALGDRR